MPGWENAWGFKDQKNPQKKTEQKNPWKTSKGKLFQNKYSLVLRKLSSY